MLTTLRPLSGQRSPHASRHDPVGNGDPERKRLKPPKDALKLGRPDLDLEMTQKAMCGLGLPKGECIHSAFQADDVLDFDICTQSSNDAHQAKAPAVRPPGCRRSHWEAMTIFGGTGQPPDPWMLSNASRVTGRSTSTLANPASRVLCRARCHLRSWISPHLGSSSSSSSPALKRLKPPLRCTLNRTSTFQRKPHVQARSVRSVTRCTVRNRGSLRFVRDSALPTGTRLLESRADPRKQVVLKFRCKGGQVRLNISVEKTGSKL